MIKQLALIVGAVFIAIGILGFIPALAPQDYLVGIFHVNGPHNMVHLVSGAIAVLTGLISEAAARRYFQIFGIVYTVVTVMGFFVGEGFIFGFLSNNMADVILHLAISALSLYAGFGMRRQEPALATNPP
jgi:hypothetical protein